MGTDRCPRPISNGMDILSVLVGKQAIPQGDVGDIEAAVRKGASLYSVLKQRGVPSGVILEARGEIYKIPTRILDVPAISFEVLRYIPQESAKYYRFVPIAVTDGTLEVGIVDPDNIEAKDALSFISSKMGLPFKLFHISDDDFDAVMEAYKGISGEVTKALSELPVMDLGEGVEVTSVDRPEDISGTEDREVISGAKIVEEAPVTKIVATILRYAIEGNASDIHVEHMGDNVRVRFRVDGELNTSLVLPTNVHRSVVARIKVLSNMKLDEKRRPQDGRFSARIAGREVDFRVSTFPSYYGEKVVMRILDKEKGVRRLEDLGMRKEDVDMVRRAIRRPYGIILISGPTGSGKSTTLYAMLNEVDKEKLNVLSLEDPVEYNIPGMSQAQVHPEIGFTFAEGLRTTLRQDPDIIMVGEIRDKETAELAIQAALTGHLVFSTIHTNDAVGIIPRLIDLGVDPFLIAPTLALGMAQRLVRTLCKGGGKEIPIQGPTKAFVESLWSDLPPQYKKSIPSKLYGIDKTPDCPVGTRGRMAVFEMFEMDKVLEEAVVKDPTDVTVEKIVRAKGMLTMQQDALLKSADRLVPFEEASALSGAALEIEVA